MVDVLLDRPVNPDLLRRLGSAGRLHAPFLVDIEFLQVLRRYERDGLVTADLAHEARRDFWSLPLTRYAHEPLEGRIWELRSNVTAYDAAFLALGEVLELPLLTTDGRMAEAPGHRARVEVFRRP